MTELKSSIPKVAGRPQRPSVEAPPLEPASTRLPGLGAGADSPPVRRWWRWPAARLGRVVQRICSKGDVTQKDCCTDRCQFWILCQCAKDEYRSATSLEDRVWWILAACGAAAILYWLLAT